MALVFSHYVITIKFISIKGSQDGLPMGCDLNDIRHKRRQVYDSRGRECVKMNSYLLAQMTILRNCEVDWRISDVTISERWLVQLLLVFLM